MKDIDIKDVNLIKELGELNSKFYVIFGEFDKNKDFFQKPKYQDEIAKLMFDAYKRELDILLAKYDWLYDKEIYKLTVEQSYTKPRRRRRWYFPFKKKSNTAAKLIEQMAAIEFGKIVERKNAELEAALESGNQEPMPAIFGDEDTEEPRDESAQNGSIQDESTQDEPAQDTPPKEITEGAHGGEQPPADGEPEPKKKRHKRGKKDVQTPADTADGEFTEEPFEGGKQLKLNITDNK